MAADRQARRQARLSDLDGVIPTDATTEDDDRWTDPILVAWFAELAGLLEANPSDNGGPCASTLALKLYAHAHPDREDLAEAAATAARSDEWWSLVQR
jgi:hypothetical protein